MIFDSRTGRNIETNFFDFPQMQRAFVTVTENERTTRTECAAVETQRIATDFTDPSLTRERMSIESNPIGVDLLDR